VKWSAGGTRFNTTYKSRRRFRYSTNLGKAVFVAWGKHSKEIQISSDRRLWKKALESSGVSHDAGRAPVDFRVVIWSMKRKSQVEFSRRNGFQVEIFLRWACSNTICTAENRSVVDRSSFAIQLIQE
jgi:hypothetical protein